MKRLYTFLGILYFTCLFYACDNLAFIEKEQKLEAYFYNNHPLDSRLKQVYTVLTYNIHMGFTDDQNAFQNADGNSGASPEHLDALAAAIRSVDPDFVALQDVGRNVTHTIIQDQAAYLADALGMNYAYADYSEVNTANDLFIRGTRGHVLLTKFEILGIENLEVLNQNRYESRYCLVTEIKINEQQSIALLNTHFRGGVSEAAKFYEVNQIIDIASRQQSPVVICGDFNNTINHSSIAKLNAAYPSVFTLVPNAERVAVEANATQIDNIFVEDELIKVQQIGGTEDIYWDLSDHRLMYARFSF